MTFLFFKKFDNYIIPLTIYFINMIFFAFVINIDEEYKEDWYLFIICKEVLSICKAYFIRRDVFLFANLGSN